MTESVYVNSDLSKIVPEGDPKAAYRIHLDEAKRRGLLDETKANKIVESPNGDAPAKRTYTRRATKNE
jgi:hypothetical protein